MYYYYYCILLYTCSRCQSPAVSPFVSGSSWLSRGAQLHSSARYAYNTSSMRPESVGLDCTEYYQPYTPALCLDHIWTDYVTTSQ